MRETLRKYERFKNRIKRLQAELDELDEMADMIRSASSGECIRSSKISHPTEDMAIKMADLRHRLNAEIELLHKNMHEVNSLIDLLPDERKQLILTLRYINCIHSYEDIGNRLDIPIGPRQVKRLHDESIDELKKIYLGVAPHPDQVYGEWSKQ